jgi:hypothetical protein
MQWGILQQLETELLVEMMRAYLEVNPAIGGLLYVGAFFDEECLQIGVQVGATTLDSERFDITMRLQINGTPVISSYKTQVDLNHGRFCAVPATAHEDPTQIPRSAPWRWAQNSRSDTCTGWHQPIGSHTTNEQLPKVETLT